MTEVPALLVYDAEEPLGALKRLLDDQSISSHRVHSCNEAAQELERWKVLRLVFTDTQLPDGTWRDVLTLVSKAAAPAAVIVVSRFVDVPLYLDAIESGAADFLVPPFVRADLAHVIRCVVENLPRTEPTRVYAVGLGEIKAGGRMLS